MRMKLSAYAIRVRSRDGGTIVYHPISKAVVKLPFPPETADEDILARLSDDEKAALRREMVILPKAHDETLLYRHWYDQLKYGTRGMSITYHTTFSCNLACSYCYQRPVAQNEGSWTARGVDRSWEFTERLVREKRPECLEACFIGGEPLLSSEHIADMASRIRGLGLPSSLLVVTNGTLLGRDIVLRLKKAGVREYQVTIDGPKKTHDRLRMSKSGSGTFDSIITRILEVQDDCDIHLNVNISRDNLGSMPALLREIKRRGVRSQLMFSMVFEHGKNAFLAAFPVGGPDGAWLSAHRVAIKAGHKFPPFYRNSYGPCAFSRENYYILGPNGELYACMSGAGQERYQVGTINDDPRGLELRMSQFLERDLRREECWQCRLLPLCNGGCFYKADAQGRPICYAAEIRKNDIPLLEECLAQL